jgi:glycosyltransferase involved in cell wall biosynthesis
MKVKRVAHLTSVHLRNDVRIFEKEAVSLASEGYETFLLVGDGSGDETRDGVRRVDVGRAPRSRLARMLVQPLRIVVRAAKLRADVYHFHDPELIFIGLILRACGAHVIYDSHEDLPRDVMSKQWIPGALRPAVGRAVEILEDFSARHFSAVVTATPHIERRFAAVNPRSIAVNNFPQRSEISFRANPIRAERTVCYIGGIGMIRGAMEMVRALEGIDATLVLAGPFESVQTEATLRALPGWAKVDYRGCVTREEVRRILAEARAGLLFFHPVPNHVDAQPNKMFEYMSAGLPVLASDFPLWRSLLVESGAGQCANPLEPEAIADLITTLLDDPGSALEMGRRGRELVMQRYQWDVENRKLQALYRTILQ